jgi:hypothetical protein
MSAELSWLDRFERRDVETDTIRLEGMDEKQVFRALDTEFVEVVMPEDVPRIFVVSTRCLDQLNEWWTILQPDVLRKDIRRGWQPVDNFGPFLGTAGGRQFDFGDHDLEAFCQVKSLGEDGFCIINRSDVPLELIATRRSA